VAGIWHDEAAGAWLLEMRSSAYALGLADGRAALRHLHWGAPLPRAALADLLAAGAGEMPRRERQLSAGRERPDEYVPWGGLRYDEPSLKAEFADGTRGVEWCVAGHRVTREGPVCTLDIDLADTVHPLGVTLSYRVYDGPTPRTGGCHSALVGGCATCTAAGRRRPSSCRPRSPQERSSSRAAAAPPAASSIPGSRWTRTGPPPRNRARCGAARWGGAVPGSWCSRPIPAGGCTPAAASTTSTGPYRLEAGDELVLPRFAGLHTVGGHGAASREWHAWQLAHVLGRGDDRPGLAAPARAVFPRTAVASADSAPPPLRPVLYNSWEATSFQVTEDGQVRLAELAARLGVECFVMDDGWFGARDNDRAGLGDWTANREKFPRGLGPLIGRVNDLGLRFGLWVGPEMVNPDSDLYRAHPDWVYHFAGRTRSQYRNQLVLNLARPDVAEWVFATLDRLLSENHIEFVKWDMNRPFSEPGWPAQAGRDPERIWTDHVSNLYAVIDRLRAAHPGVDFESCSAGGGRVDLGILRRVEQVWPSDNTDAWDRAAIQEGFTQVYPPQVMSAWVTDSPNFLTGRELPLRFRFHVAMAGALGVGGDLLRWTDAELAEAAELIALYKEIRPVIQRGRLYRLASVQDGPLGASEYIAGDDVVVLAWWGPQPAGVRPARVRLAGLNAGARYRDTGSGQRHWGSALLAEGLVLARESASGFGSALVRLVRDERRPL
jgi:alpha-galactosidase